MRVINTLLAGWACCMLLLRIRQRFLEEMPQLEFNGNAIEEFFKEHKP